MAQAVSSMVGFGLSLAKVAAAWESGLTGGGAEERINLALWIRLLSKRKLCKAQRSPVGRATGGLYIRLCAVWKPAATEEIAIANIAK